MNNTVTHTHTHTHNFINLENLNYYFLTFLRLVNVINVFFLL